MKAELRTLSRKRIEAGKTRGQTIKVDKNPDKNEILATAYEHDSWNVFVKYLLINLLPEIQEIRLSSHLDENIVNVVREYTKGSQYNNLLKHYASQSDPMFYSILTLVQYRSSIFFEEIFGSGKKQMTEMEQRALNSIIAKLIQIIIKILTIGVQDINNIHQKFETIPINTKNGQSAKIIPEALEYKNLDNSIIKLLRESLTEQLSSLKQLYPQLF